MSLLVQILVYLVLAAVLLLALVGVPVLVTRAVKLRLNGTDMPGEDWHRDPGEQGPWANYIHAEPIDQPHTEPMPVYDPTYDWPADPGGTVSDLRSYGTASKKPKGDV